MDKMTLKITIIICAIGTFIPNIFAGILAILDNDAVILFAGATASMILCLVSFIVIGTVAMVTN